MVQGKVQGKGIPWERKKKKRKDVRGRSWRAGTGTSHLLPDTFCVLHRERRVYVGAGSIAIKRRTPVDSRMIPEESEGVEDHGKLRGGEDLKLGEVMAAEDDGIVWKEFA